MDPPLLEIGLEPGHPFLEILAEPPRRAAQTQKNHYHTRTNLDCDCGIRPVGTSRVCPWCQGRYRPLSERDQLTVTRARRSRLPNLR